MADEAAHDDVSAGIAELQSLLLGTQDIREFLQELALAARRVTSGVSCGITLQPNGRPLTAEGKHIGALNLYATIPEAFGPAETRRAESFAANATGAIALAVRQAASADLTSQLRAALASRAVIDQALGVIMAQERCTHDQAFAVLRSASQNRNIKLHDIAAEIVTSVSGEVPQPPPFEEI